MGTIVAYAMPVLPGQEDRVRNYAKEIEPHREEFERLNREGGVKHFTTYLQEAPQGNMQITVMEVDDPSKIRPGIPGGTPYDDWWLDYIRDVNGVDLRNTPEDEQPTPPEPVFHWPG